MIDVANAFSFWNIICLSFFDYGSLNFALLFYYLKSSSRTSLVCSG